jgi:hypothetical protein
MLLARHVFFAAAAFQNRRTDDDKTVQGADILKNFKKRRETMD